MQERDDLAARPRVEVPGRLVGEDDHGSLRDRARDRHPLALPAGHLLRPVLESMPEPDALERERRRLASLPRRGAGVEHPAGDVLDRRHRVLKVKALEHEPDLVRPQPGELGVRGVDHVVAGDLDGALGRALERAEHGQHRRLP